MEKKIIYSEQAPNPVGHYSQALEVKGQVFISGQIGIDPKTGLLTEGFENQLQRVLENLEAVCEAADCGLDNIVKVGIYLCDLGQFAQVNAAMAAKFGQHKPARSTIEVPKLPLGALIEMDAVAIK